MVIFILGMFLADNSIFFFEFLRIDFENYSWKLKKNPTFLKFLWTCNFAYSFGINFSKFITLQNHLLPTKITFEEINTRNMFIHEEIIFTKVLINEPLPEKIIGFRLPDNVEIKEVEW